jgi:hypothetical protein
MKKLLYLLFMPLALLVLVTSCSPEEDDLFNDTAANRIKKEIAAVKEVLLSSPNGWVMEFFPSDAQIYGGYNLLISFTEDGHTSVVNELYMPVDATTNLPKDEVVSTYVVKQYGGVLLSFDTYNEALHYFSDPLNPGGTGSAGKGMEGDFEFNIMKFSKDELLVRGLKTHNWITMKPLQGTREEYLAKVSEIDEVISTFSLLNLEVGGVTYKGLKKRNRALTYTENGEEVDVAYILTPTGCRFYEPITLNGVEIGGEFTYDASTKTFTNVNNSAVKLVEGFMPINERFTAGQWFIKGSDSGPFALENFNKNGLAKLNPSEELYYGYFGNGSILGSSYAANYGFCFACYNGSGLYGGALNYTYQYVGEDKILLKYARTGGGDGLWYYQNAGFNYVITPFGLQAGRTFTITTDNDAEPTWMMLSEDANPDNWMKLSADRVLYPLR